MLNSNALAKAIIAEEVPSGQSTNSPRMQDNDIQATDQVHKIYYIQNCGMVYINSLNARTSHMQNCGNHLPQVNYHGATVIDQASNIELSHQEFSATGSNPTDPLFQTQTTAVKSEDPKEIADVPLQTNNYRPHLYPTKTPRPFQRSDFSSDRAKCELEHLEQLLGTSLATAAVVRFSGNTFADILTPRAYDVFKAFRALDVSFSSSNRIVGDLPTASSDIRNDYFSNPHQSFPSPSPNLAAPGTSRSHILIPVHHAVLFSSAILMVFSCLVFFIIAFPRLCIMREWDIPGQDGLF